MISGRMDNFFSSAGISPCTCKGGSTRDLQLRSCSGFCSNVIFHMETAPPPDAQMLSHGRPTPAYLTSEPMSTYTVFF
jgi:hypothetical protein